MRSRKERSRKERELRQHLPPVNTPSDPTPNPDPLAVYPNRAQT